MDLLSNLFVFYRNSKGSTFVINDLKLNIINTTYELYYKDSKVTIDCEVLRNHSSTMVLIDNLQSQLFTVYNWKEIAEIFNTTNSNLLNVFNQPSVMQIDKCNDTIFSKVFLPDNQLTLKSDTSDFSTNVYYTIDFIHPLDWQYHTTFDAVKLEHIGDRLIGELCIAKGILEEEMFINYAGQSIPITNGMMKIDFKFVPGNNLYLGSLSAQYQGRCLEVEKCLNTIRN